MWHNIQGLCSCRTEPICARSGRCYQAEGIECEEDPSIEEASRLHILVPSILIKNSSFLYEICVEQGII